MAFVSVLLTAILLIIVTPMWIHTLMIAYKVKKNPKVIFDAESLEYKFFELAGYDNYTESYFNDFNNKTSKTYWRRQFNYIKKATIVIAAGLVLWAPYLCATGVVFYGTLSILDKLLMDYYFWTYYEVDMKLVPKDKDEE